MVPGMVGYTWLEDMIDPSDVGGDGTWTGVPRRMSVDEGLVQARLAGSLNTMRGPDESRTCW